MGVFINFENSKEKQKRLEENLDDLLFIEEANLRRIDVNNIFVNRKEKEFLLREYKGFQSLKTLGNKHNEYEKNKNWNSYSSEQIGLAFKKTYFSTLRKIENLFS